MLVKPSIPKERRRSPDPCHLLNGKAHTITLPAWIVVVTSWTDLNSVGSVPVQPRVGALHI